MSKPPRWKNLVPHRHVIEVMGGPHKLGVALSLNASTVRSWWDSGHIPSRHHEAIMEAALRTNTELSPSDFFAEKWKHGTGYARRNQRQRSTGAQQGQAVA